MFVVVFVKVTVPFIAIKLAGMLLDVTSAVTFLFSPFTVAEPEVIAIAVGAWVILKLTGAEVLWL